MNMWGPPASSFFRGWRRAVIGRTWPAHRPHSQLDHVLVTPAIEVVDARVADATGSDHRPVVVTLAPGLTRDPRRTGIPSRADGSPAVASGHARPPGATSTRASSPPRAPPAPSTGPGPGPAVIVISEIPGITPNVARFARMVAGIGCTAVMPHLFGDDGGDPTMPLRPAEVAKACVSKEFTILALNRTSPVTVWLRALARAEHERCGGPGVGVVGMCLTGGFALAMMVDDVVVAPVLSQPSLPFPVSAKHRRGLGHQRRRRRAGPGAGGRRRLRARPALHRETRRRRPSASPPCASCWATGSSAWSSTRRRATPTATARAPIRC